MLSISYHLDKIWRLMAGLTVDEGGSQLAPEVYLPRIYALMVANADSGGEEPGGSSEPQRVTVKEISTSPYTLELEDEGKMLHIITAPMSIIVPPESEVAFPDGAVIGVRMIADGDMGFDWVEGDVWSLNGALVLAGQYATASLHKHTGNTWYLDGAIASL